MDQSKSPLKSKPSETEYVSSPLISRRTLISQMSALGALTLVSCGHQIWGDDETPDWFQVRCST